MRTLKPDSEVSRQCLAQRRAKAAGICTRCFKPSRPGKRYCAACAAKAYGELRKWVSVNPERAAHLVKRWQQANPEKMREYARRFAEMNPNRIAEYQKNHREKKGFKTWQPGSRGRVPNWVKEIQKL